MRPIRSVEPWTLSLSVRGCVSRRMLGGSVRLLPEFSYGVDLKKVPASDVLAIVRELVQVSESMESIPDNGAVWDSLRKQHPMSLRVNGWLVQYVVDEKHER